MWNQVKGFNRAKGGNKKGLCLQNVRLGYDIPGKYDNATTAWNNTQQHRDRNVPAGIDVPLYYTYVTTIDRVTKNYGHINVRLANGQVWSDGEIFSSIADYESKKAPDFIGWGESVNDVRVIQHVPDPPKPAIGMPAVGSRIQLIPKDKRTTFRAGTATQAGTINVIDDSFKYVVRGYDAKFPGRVLINSASAGGDNVGLALYYVSGARIPGWKQI